MNNWKRIVGGEHVSIDVVPWQALIQQHLSLSDDTTTTTIQCGAVLIDPMWILSASHCIQQPWYRYPIDVYFGLTNITATIIRQSTIRSVKRVFDPAKYDPQLSGDLILLQLNESIIIGETIQPIYLPESDENFDYHIGTVSGYGSTLFQKTFKPANILHMIQVPILPTSSCIELYKKAFKDGATTTNVAMEFIRNKKLICAGYKQGGYDACIGDSGGPLAVCVDDWMMTMAMKRSISMNRLLLTRLYPIERQPQQQRQRQCNGKWKLAGIISIGYRCAEPSIPGLYIDITVYANWIRSIIHSST
ncbi:hypothetical protein HUG17_9921 [Dermatophagoides farinae]|nr:hypothetical protein HUG17_9921 [Dermatophagoides farinae]